MKKSPLKPGALKSLLKSNKNNTRVLHRVEKHLISRPNDRDLTVMHPSAMASSAWCHREQYWQLLGRKPFDKGTSLKTQIVFSTGHGAHANWQTWFSEMGTLKGLWFCHTCQEQWFGFSKDHTGSSFCKIDYEEVPLNFDPLRMRGHADGWLVGFEDPLLLEVKTIGEGSLRWYAPHLLRESDQDWVKAWEKIEQPFSDHITQAQIYLKLGELMGLKDFPTEIAFIYEAKGIHEIKEFIVRKSDFSVAPIFDAAAMIIQAIDNGKPPLCNIAGNLKCSKCVQYEESNGLLNH